MTEFFNSHNLYTYSTNESYIQRSQVGMSFKYSELISLYDIDFLIAIIATINIWIFTSLKIFPLV
jgi:hypothetical protein